MDLKNNQSTSDVVRVPKAKAFITFCKSQILASFEIEPHDMVGKQINLPNPTMLYKFLFWSSLGWRVTMTPMQPNFLPVRKRGKKLWNRDHRYKLHLGHDKAKEREVGERRKWKRWGHPEVSFSSKTNCFSSRQAKLYPLICKVCYQDVTNVWHVVALKNENNISVIRRDIVLCNISPVWSVVPFLVGISFYLAW